MNYVDYKEADSKPSRSGSAQVGQLHSLLLISESVPNSRNGDVVQLVRCLPLRLCTVIGICGSNTTRIYHMMPMCVQLSVCGSTLSANGPNSMVTTGSSLISSLATQLPLIHNHPTPLSQLHLTLVFCLSFDSRSMPSSFETFRAALVPFLAGEVLYYDLSTHGMHVN
jgi:hypothetical protein